MGTIAICKGVGERFFKVSKARSARYIELACGDGKKWQTAGRLRGRGMVVIHQAGGVPCTSTPRTDHHWQ